MDTEAIAEYMVGWGYRTLPKHHMDSPGYSGLVVAIRPELTLQHFDPQRISLTIQDEGGEATQRTLSWLTPGGDFFRVCAGTIALRDRHGRAAEFFTFGGRLQIAKGEQERIYEFRSPAPVLELTDERETVADQLASEVEQLVAQARAGWNGDDGGIDRVLGDLDPSLLYTAAVNALLERLLTSEAMMTAYSGLADTLTHEKAWLRQQGLWLSNLPTMAALLSPVRQRQVPASG